MTNWSGMQDAPDLSPEEKARYARHLVLPEVTAEGQLRLKRSSVLLVGAGGLGSPAALYLAAAGVGRIGIVDFDLVDESNLQRQILHDTSWVGRPKLESAVARLSALNPHVARRGPPRGPHPGERPLSPGRLRRGGRRHRQLRDALPDERRVLLPEEAQRLRLHLPLRGAGERLLGRPRALLPVPVPRAPAPRPRPELRGGRRPRRPPRRRRGHPGHRGPQDPAGGRGAPRGPPAPLRRARHALRRAQAPARSRVPPVLAEGHDPRAAGLPGLLRDREGRGGRAGRGDRRRAS